MASHANVPLGRNFYVTSKGGSKGGGVALLCIREGKTKSHLGLDFRLLVGALHCLGKNVREITAHQDFEAQVDMAEKDMQLAVVGSTYDGERWLSADTLMHSRANCLILSSDEYTVAIRRRRLTEGGSWQFTKAGVNLPTASLRHLLQLFLRGGEYDLLPLSAHKSESTVSSAFFG